MLPIIVRMLRSWRCCAPKAPSGGLRCAGRHVKLLADPTKSRPYWTSAKSIYPMEIPFTLNMTIKILKEMYILFGSK